ncbi:MAG TPA: hypothetical protein DCR14_18225 [Acidimicrobiaceae bacterium]|nr:hypothetical protein [Acidimicrobiaceae bacterium]
MSDAGLHTWLEALGFVADDAALELAVAGTGGADDPWADVDVGAAPLTAAQRAHVSGLLSSLAMAVDDADLLAEADRQVISFPEHPDDAEPFDQS